ncbi:MAG TPA: AbrB/MazE/SpoVT family DNA-binding domain-containing protein [Clostridiales bacterium]|nr:AbrB/MazE/SpoVT family DNA-binding domain-containing protein [Clostridiales bacterium]
MKRTGIVRKIDELGRIVLPKELRRTMEINIKDPMEIYTDNEYIIVKKYTPNCTFCGSNESLGEFKEKCVCAECMAELKK